MKFFYLAFTILLLSSCSKTSYQTYTNSNIGLDSAYNANELESTIAPYRLKVDAEMNEVIGYADSALIKYTPESPLGNFTADIVFNEGLKHITSAFEKATKNNTIALLNFGGLRAPINEGNITIGNVYELMPFDNTITIVKIKGNAIKNLLIYLYTMDGQPVSNGNFVLEENKHQFSVNGKPFDLNQNLYIITSNYLASGGDKMNFLKNAEEKWDSGILMRDTFIAYIRKEKGLGPQLKTGRIKIIK